jgi:hypothetical protein
MLEASAGKNVRRRRVLVTSEPSDADLVMALVEKFDDVAELVLVTDGSAPADLGDFDVVLVTNGPTGAASTTADLVVEAVTQSADQTGRPGLMAMVLDRNCQYNELPPILSECVASGRARLYRPSLNGAELTRWLDDAIDRARTFERGPLE